MKARYAARPGTTGAFCDLPILDGAEKLEKFLNDPDWRFKPFIIRKGSTLSKEGYARDFLVRNAKKHQVAARYGHSWTIVQANGQAEQEVSFESFVQDHMHTKQYDGSTQMERPYLFQDDSPLLRLRDAKFSMPPFIQSLQTLSNLTFTKDRTTEALLIGAALSGIGFHRHSATLQMLAYGYKRWMLYAPDRSPPGGDDGGWPIYDWVDKVYPSLEEDVKPIECIQKPRDLIWIPESWFHATLNLADTVAVSTQSVDGESKSYMLQRRVSMLALTDSKGLGYLKSLMKLQPNNVCAKADMAQQLIAQGKKAKAESLLREVLKKDPFHMSAIVMLTALLDHDVDVKKIGAEKKLEATLKTLIPTLEMNSRSYAANRLLSRYYEQTRNRMKYDQYERRLDFLEQIDIYETDLFNHTMTYLGNSQARQDL